MFAKESHRARWLLTVFTAVFVCIGVAGVRDVRGGAIPGESILDPTATPMPTPIPIDGLWLTEGNNGQDVALRMGQTLGVNLAANPSTGYFWAVADMDASLLSQVAPPEFTATSSLPGAPQKQLWRFKVAGVGRSNLRLVYRRPWEAGVEAARQFTLHVSGLPPSTPAGPNPIPVKGSTGPRPVGLKPPQPEPGRESETGPSKPGGRELPGDLPGGWSAVMAEGFEGVFPSASWSLYWNNDPSSEGYGYTWDDDPYRPRTGAWSGWCADGQYEGKPDKGAPGPYLNGMNAWMVYGPFDLSNATSAELDFSAWYKTEANYDFLWAAVSVGGDYYGLSYSGDSNGWQSYILDLGNVPTLGNVCGFRNVWIAFSFQSDLSVVDEGAYLDDILLKKRGPLPSLPSSSDWRSAGLTPVKDQGECGSCWAFGTVGQLEANIRIKDGITTDLAEQYLVSCNVNGWGCSGGWFAHDYHLWWSSETQALGGAVLEAVSPYLALDVPCAGPYLHPYQIDSWACIDPSGIKPSCSRASGYSGYSHPSLWAIKQAILTYGPVSVGVAAGWEFSSYTGGIFNVDETAAVGYVNHVVVLVGWDDNQGLNGVWILRNSWGPGWGEGGYMRIAYGTSLVGANANYVSRRARSETHSDLDGDWKTDLVVWRPSNGGWYGLTSSSGYSYSSAFYKPWGASGDTPVSGDLDGDGKMDLVVWRPSNGGWYGLTSSSGYSYGSSFSHVWGVNGDIPLAGDLDGDGKMDQVVWRPSNGGWYGLTSSSGYSYASSFSRVWGTNGDVPVK